MRNVFPPEWRTQNRRRRRFYSRYMRSLERAGYALVCGVFGAFVFAFNYPVEDLVTADKVKIEPLTAPLSSKTPTLVVSLFAKDGDEVKEGQPLLEVVASEADIPRFQKWRAVHQLKDEVGETPEVVRLFARYPRPTTYPINAPMDGVFRVDEAAVVGKSMEAEAPLGRVVDYRELRLSASLAGQTVPKAAVGQPARLTSIAIDPEEGTLFRAGGTLSGRLLGSSVKDVLSKELSGKGVRLRDDIPLKVAEISEVQIDARATRTEGGDATKAIPLDPPADLLVKAEILEGQPMASVQIADLPADVEAKARQAVRAAVNGKAVRRPDGSVATLVDAEDVRMVVKLKAERASSFEPNALSATSLSRSFDAKLRIPSPPAFLVDAVRAADANGKAVTARVEVQTGTRPIAFILLRKS
jgi:hypothetical protein